MIDFLRRAAQRVRSFFAKQSLDGDLDAEMAAHLDFAIEENLRRGLPPEEARRQALVRFGGVTQARQQHREVRGLTWLDILLQDLRYTFRTLCKDRGFTLVAVLILALGIGANVAVFSVVNTILLRPLPFYQSDRLVWIAPPDSGHDLSGSTYSADAYEDLRAMNHSYTEVTGYYAFSSPDNRKLTGSGEPVPVTDISVAGNFFRVLGVDPVLGRSFNEEEIRLGGPSVLLANAFWRRQFHGDPNMVGRAVEIDGKPVTVIGVLPPSFDFGAVFSPGAKVDMFDALNMNDIREQGNTLTFLGRLKPGVTLAQARQEAVELFPKFYWGKKYPDTLGAYKDRGYPIFLKDYVSGSLRRSLIVLWSAVGLILLIVCVNLSNLLLARSAAHGKEFAMRMALGAGRARIVRQLLTESVLLSLGGSVGGLALAWAAVSWLAHQGSIALPLLSDIRIDLPALAWTVLIAVGAAVLFGLAPAFRMSGRDIQGTLKDAGVNASSGRRHDRMRAVLVISEVALACVLLVGAGLLLHSFLRVLDVDLGFQPTNAAAIRLDYDDGNDAGRRAAILQEMQRRVEAIPGVEVAGITDNLPLERNRGWGITAKGATPKEERSAGNFVYIVTPGYLRAIGMRLVDGRDLTWDDSVKSEKVGIINEAGARELWPGANAVGRIANTGGEDIRIVGVVADVHESNVEGKPGVQTYLPITQFGPSDQSLVVRSRMPPSALAGTILRTLRMVSPGQPASEFRPMQSIVDRAVSPRRFFVALVACFAGLGLLLASLGIYGVISYSVTQQTKEIGIRMALGATAARVQMGVIRRTLLLAVIGIAVGGVLSLAFARVIASLLFGTHPTDPMAFSAMTILLVGVALLAGYFPARRASRIDPLAALRNN